MKKEERQQNDPKQIARIKSNGLLIDAGSCCTKEIINRMRMMKKEAMCAATALQKLPYSTIRDAGCANVLYSAQHNVSAIAICLSTAADAAEYLNREIASILHAIDAEEMREIREAISIAKERKMAEKKHAEYVRKKKRDAEALAKTIDQ